MTDRGAIGALSALLVVGLAVAVIAVLGPGTTRPSGQSAISDNPASVPSGVYGAFTVAPSTADDADSSGAPPLQSAPGEPDASCCPQPTARVGTNDRERSDIFWSALLDAGALYEFEYTSLPDIVESVDLIVRGRVSHVYLRPFSLEGRDMKVVWIDFAIGEVLKGVPESRADGLVSIFTLPAPWDWVRLNQPNHEHTLFLMNEGEYLTKSNMPVRDAEYARYTYWLPNDQSVLRDFGGDVSVIDAANMEFARGPNRYPLDLEGQSYDAVLAQIRMAVSDTEQPR